MQQMPNYVFNMQFSWYFVKFLEYLALFIHLLLPLLAQAQEISQKIQNKWKMRLTTSSLRYYNEVAQWIKYNLHEIADSSTAKTNTKSKSENL